MRTVPPIKAHTAYRTAHSYSSNVAPSYPHSFPISHSQALRKRSPVVARDDDEDAARDSIFLPYISIVKTYSFFCDRMEK